MNWLRHELVSHELPEKTKPIQFMQHAIHERSSIHAIGNSLIT